MKPQIALFRHTILVSLIIGYIFSTTGFGQDADSGLADAFDPTAAVAPGDREDLAEALPENDASKTLSDEAIESIPPSMDVDNAKNDSATKRHNAVRNKFLFVFSGEADWPFADNLQDQMTVNVRTYSQVYSSPNVQTQRVVFRSQTVNPADPNLSAEQKLAVGVKVIEGLISEKRREVNLANSDEARSEFLDELRELYELRFELDSAYQDFKVSEIERRAKKLREDVHARDSEREDWVQAMVTLARMQARGIETMAPRGLDPNQGTGQLTPDSILLKSPELGMDLPDPPAGLTTPMTPQQNPPNVAPFNRSSF